MGRLLDNLDTVLDDDFFEQLIQLPIDKHDNSLTLNEILGIHTHEQYTQNILIQSYKHKPSPFLTIVKIASKILYQNNKYRGKNSQSVLIDKSIHNLFSIPKQGLTR